MAGTSSRDEILAKYRSLEDRVIKLETESNRETTLESKGIGGYKYSAQDIEDLTGVSHTRLQDLAKSNYAPCIISETGEIYFKKQEIIRWMKNNLFVENEGQELPFRISVYSFNPPEIDSSIPKELSDVPGLAQYTDIHFPPCIYFLVKDDKVIYVGQTTNLPARLIQHEKDKVYSRAFYITVPRRELDRVERDFIHILQPRLNQKKY